MALLSAVKAGIFVVQAAGNTGPSPKSISSFSPWIFTVGAAAHDRIYSNSIVLGNNITIQGVGLAPGTDTDAMYTLVSAIHALNDTTAANDMYVSECQDASNFNQDIVQGNLLICSYSIRFVLGLSTIKQALETAKNLSAAGVVFYMDPYVIGFQLNPIPMRIPGIIIPSPDDSKVLLQYYNSSLGRDGTTKKIIKFGGVASISGGIKANFSRAAPKIMYYSARGPDPEDSSLDDADILKPNIVALEITYGLLGVAVVPTQLNLKVFVHVDKNSFNFALDLTMTISTGESFAMMSGKAWQPPMLPDLPP
ncbi:UNVERIFIED_CONTAM: Subtilisin-like protease SBT2.2 [Sesamum angustifolium]|uniref:Subtilisin-like protease SBT2.2 n=1 Tax=Sesamum angustifolium TaxID=2727405 RepID=A0AAW2P8X0_9LAMI